MKTLLKITLAFLMFLSVNAFAQETMIPEIKYADLEKYIEMARQNYPKAKALELKTSKTKADVTIASLSYLDLFSANYFIRPDNKTVLDPINPYNVNGVQFSIGLNLGNFVSKPFTVKKAKDDYKIAQLEAKDYDNQLVLLVKSRYYDYIQAINLLKINTQMASDNKGVAETLRNRFEKSEITLDTYNQSRILQFQAYQAKIQAESVYLKAKDLLEEVVGSKLSDVK
ncbi:TolC family protein [Pedobacter sp. Leaf194]|uniref:TolC family protein n=1 Tax=Pedobacter sp. Leaf194 TaxID=1736297 RepID=UPI000702419B|nr:TolC family protein [Pedobacter sp. Leaf194]KQS32295.1 hypothetical protein ASG14_17295 [Pedobacter sp. Leaf194]